MTSNQPDRFQENGWYFACKVFGDQFLAWCCQKPLVGSGPLLEPAENEVWFEYGDTREEALTRLKREVGAVTERLGVKR